MAKKQKNIILEVTTKQLYIIPKGHSSLSIKNLKEEWFVTFANRSHAFKDNCLVGGSNEVIEVKELSDREVMLKFEKKKGSF